ncbi:MAG: DNA polymerase I [Gammaproteobacteria bacterium]|jgi:DNA polymerase-1|nr:MAG: DNA polymerase I [Oceanospirillaceae bacterium UBA2001]|tara:strand:+ start:10556 stop:13378 length:2823 start_codon:yes stop_codon:yes gene_type:complete
MTVKVSTPVVLVDGSSYLFRAYHAMPPLNNSKGMPTGAIKGVVNMMRSLAKDYANANIVVVFDAKGPTFRNEMYAQYKAHRPPMPDDMRPQIEPIHQIINAMGLPLLIIPGVEADDVIGTLAAQATAQGIDTLISTGDKDMAQLVSPHVGLVNTMTNTYLDEEGVFTKFGVRPDQIIDYLAIVGDTADNIPGVPGAGPKTAVKWLAAYDTLENLMEKADEIGGKIGEKLRNALDFLPLSQALTTIKLDVELEQSLDQMAPKPVDQAALLALYEDLEFRSWANVLIQDGVTASSLPITHGHSNADTNNPSNNSSNHSSHASLNDNEAPQKVIPTPQAVAHKNYSTVTTLADLAPWLKACKEATIFAFDTETTSLNYMEAQLVGVSLCIEAGTAVYVPCGHDYVGAPEQISRPDLIAAIKPLLEDATQVICGQNLKYDINVLANYNIHWQAKIIDSMVQSYVLNSTASRHNMDALAQHYLDYQTVKYIDIAGKGVKQLTFNQVDIELASPYAAEDADITLRLAQHFSACLVLEPNLGKVYDTIERPLVPVLSRMERIGALVDAKVLGEQSQVIGKRLIELERDAYELAGEVFNLSSTQQLGAILYEKLGIPVTKKTPKGKPSTAEAVLQELAQDYELPKLLLQYRSLSKLKSTYTDKLPLEINPATGRIHTSYHQAVAATGRLSSSDPNLQNIPIRSAEGRQIRQAFVVPKGQVMVAADYSQIELRIMAHLSKDEGLLNAFATGQDVHKATAAEVFGVTVEQVSSDQRRSAKAINFGLIYGMSAFGLAKQLGISRAQSQDYIGRYFTRYPGVQEYMDHTKAIAAEQGYVETIYGRRLYLPDIKASNAIARQAAERTAINAPMQGTAADIIKRAMVSVDAWLASSGLNARMTMQVHDELIFEVDASQVNKLVVGIKSAMEGAAELLVPLIVDVGVGDNWDQAH